MHSQDRACLLFRGLTTLIVVGAVALATSAPWHQPEAVLARVSGSMPSQLTDSANADATEAGVVALLVSHHQEDLELADVILASSPLSPELESFGAEMLASRTAELQALEQWLTDHGLPMRQGPDTAIGTWSGTATDTLAQTPGFSTATARLLIEHRDEVVEATANQIGRIDDPEATTLVESILTALESEKQQLGAFLGTVSDSTLADS